MKKVWCSSVHRKSRQNRSLWEMRERIQWREPEKNTEKIATDSPRTFDPTVWSGRVPQTGRDTQGHASIDEWGPSARKKKSEERSSENVPKNSAQGLAGGLPQIISTDINDLHARFICHSPWGVTANKTTSEARGTMKTASLPKIPKIVQSNFHQRVGSQHQ